MTVPIILAIITAATTIWTSSRKSETTTLQNGLVVVQLANRYELPDQFRAKAMEAARLAAEGKAREAIDVYEDIARTAKEIAVRLDAAARASALIYDTNPGFAIQYFQWILGEDRNVVAANFNLAIIYEREDCKIGFGESEQHCREFITRAFVAAAKAGLKR